MCGPPVLCAIQLPLQDGLQRFDDGHGAMLVRQRGHAPHARIFSEETLDPVRIVVPLQAFEQVMDQRLLRIGRLARRRR
jgi:hypothetical protein